MEGPRAPLTTTTYPAAGVLMRAGCFARWAVLCWLLAAGGLLASGLAVAAPEGDVSDATAKTILERVKEKYGLEVPFLAQVLYHVPVLRATPEFLQGYGSSVGIYVRGRVYVNRDLFRPDGTIDVDSSSSVAALLHECWHAYYELLLPAPEKAALNAEFRAYYNGTKKYPAEEWMCFGDEAIGNYYGDLMAAYAYTMDKFLQAGTVPEGALKLYRGSFEAKELHGYGTDDSPAPLPISAAERAAAQRIAAGAFPPPDELVETLRKRFPKAPRPEQPRTVPSQPQHRDAGGPPDQPQSR
jgi:hypothetical protein